MLLRDLVQSVNVIIDGSRDSILLQPIMNTATTTNATNGPSSLMPRPFASPSYPTVFTIAMPALSPLASVGAMASTTSTMIALTVVKSRIFLYPMAFDDYDPAGAMEVSLVVDLVGNGCLVQVPEPAELACWGCKRYPIPLPQAVQADGNLQIQQLFPPSSPDIISGDPLGGAVGIGCLLRVHGYQQRAGDLDAQGLQPGPGPGFKLGVADVLDGDGHGHVNLVAVPFCG